MFKVMPINQLILHISTGVNICCNLWLWSFLNKMTNRNTALEAKDRKKERKRNLVPAKIGLITLALYPSTTLYFMFTFSYNSADLDSATRSFLNAAYADFFHCLGYPLLVIYGSSEARKRITEMCANMQDKITNFFSDS